MYRQKLCLGLFSNCAYHSQEQLAIFKKSGFDGFFACYESEKQILSLAKEGERLSLFFQSVHAPFLKAADLWKEGELGDLAFNELMECLLATAKAKVKIMVCHAYIGFDKRETPTNFGMKRIATLANTAKELGVKLAFENTEGEEFLSRILREFSLDETVGFCWDSGHEQCYNRGQDFLRLYGKKLLATHLNDNLGISRYDGKTYWTDDLHLLPFDGIIDWGDAARRLNREGFERELTFELKLTNIPERHELDKYIKLPFEEFIAEAYSRACRFAELKIRDRENANFRQEK